MVYILLQRPQLLLRERVVQPREPLQRLWEIPPVDGRDGLRLEDQQVVSPLIVGGNDGGRRGAEWAGALEAPVLLEESLPVLGRLLERDIL